jgi:hypothetical protein
MANIVLKTFAAGDDGQGTVTPQDDALIYQNAIPMNGIFSGATVTLSEANVLHIAAGFGIIGGRFFEINESDITVELSSSGTLLGRLYIHLELTNADVPISINAATGATLPALVGDPDLNVNDGAFDLELATFNVSEVTISDLVNTFPSITKANNQLRRATAYSVNDMVLCQSASDALIFLCTTAGTTAIQEPKAYQTVTDGNTVTDGTAVFKAVSISGQITQISKIGNLSSLNTTDKSSAVAAINEVNTKVSKTEVLISRTRKNITSNLTNLSTAISEQDLAKYGYSIGDYFVGTSDYTYILADMDTYYGGYNKNAVVNVHHVGVLVITGATSAWGSISGGYNGSTLQSYLEGTVLTNIKADMIALFGGTTGLEHLLSHSKMFTTNDTTGWAWQSDKYISALSEIQMGYGHVFSMNAYQSGEAVKPLEVFRKFRFNEIIGNIWIWLRNLMSASYACRARDDGIAHYTGVSDAGYVVGLILLI